MLPRPRNLPAGFIPPCLPMKAPKPPSGALWLHEIKHDGFRVIARKDGARVKLYSRPGASRDEDYFGVAGVAPASELRPACRHFPSWVRRAATYHPSASHFVIRVHDVASLEVTRATHPDGLLITQSVQIPRQGAVRVSARHQEDRRNDNKFEHDGEPLFLSYNCMGSPSPHCEERHTSCELLLE